ncbi:serine protease [Roseibacillus persicicus]|uniref:S1 family peptidase n=1 Tax=Roseibacillus persicicus TaxID=454148 RepID=UPI00398A64E6
MNQFLSLGLLGILCGQMWAKAPLVVDDSAIIDGFELGAGRYADEGTYPNAKAILKSLRQPGGLKEYPTGKAVERTEDGVYLLGAVYDCGKCDKWHSAGFATAWAIGSEGILCTNYHVIRSVKGDLVAAGSATGEVYPVEEIVLADESNDIAILRVKATGLKVLPLAKEPAAVGDRVHCVSHPDRHFYSYTGGEVSRYYYHRKPKKEGDRVPFMAITADYARGSSGGPILNEKNEVVGMVSNTSNIYYGKKGQKAENVLQMVMKNCVPAFKIKDLLEQVSDETEDNAEEAADLPSQN